MKRIIRLTESDLARIVRRVINEAPQFAENATLAIDAPAALGAMTICGTGTDMVPLSVTIKNTSPKAAYITSINGGDVIGSTTGGLMSINRTSFTVTVNGKKSFGPNPNEQGGKVYPLIPAGATATLNFQIGAKSVNDVRKTYSNLSGYQVGDAFKSIKKLSLTVGYNGAAPATVSIPAQGFTVNTQMGCRAAQALNPIGA
jgi:hypothetical protein